MQSMQYRYPLLDSQAQDQVTEHFLRSLQLALVAAPQAKELLQERQKRLAQQEHLLEQAAQDGFLWSEGISLFPSLLSTWAEKEALRVALAYPSLDFAAQKKAITSTFKWQLQQEAQVRWSALQLLQEQARRQRQLHDQEQAGYWQTVARQMLEEQRQRQATQVQWWTQVQQAQQHWAGLAYRGIEMAQHGQEQQYRFAEQIHAQVVQQLNATARRQELLVEQAVRQAAVRRWSTRCLLLLLLVIFGGALFGCAALAAIYLL
uniref:Uncharacterized protein n=1 Tax=Thermogemmatispora argillosa TaxID=2045280 RepID=A0A455SXH6_9CHLR|nr:hypothetical protein KTA_04750 [Thermogemmatispora argillosa]